MPDICGTEYRRWQPEVFWNRGSWRGEKQPLTTPLNFVSYLASFSDCLIYTLSPLPGYLSYIPSRPSFARSRLLHDRPHKDIRPSFSLKKKTFNLNFKRVRHPSDENTNTKVRDWRRRTMGADVWRHAWFWTMFVSLSLPHTRKTKLEILLRRGRRGA